MSPLRLRDAVEKLLAQGAGEASLFEIRRKELDATLLGRKTLADTRTVAGDLGGLKLALVLLRPFVYSVGMSNEPQWVTVAALSKLGAGEILGVEVGDKPIALYNLDGEIHATDNLCTHAFAFLSDGWLDGDCIECPLHAGRFEIKTGKALGPPVEEDIKTYPVRVVGDEIQVKLG
jgi:nitrite reductase/ring-hydroxylating ferredoxin subunit